MKKLTYSLCNSWEAEIKKGESLIIFLIENYNFEELPRTSEYRLKAFEGFFIKHKFNPNSNQED